MKTQCGRLLLVFLALLTLTTPTWGVVRSQKRAAPYVPVHVVLIDPASLSRLGPWPFDRSIHAAVLDRITQGGPQAIILNLYFGERGSRRGDTALAGSLRRSGRTWILVDPDGRPPLPELAGAAHGMGHSVVVGDDNWTNVLAGAVFAPQGRYVNVCLAVVMDLLGITARPEMTWEHKSLMVGSVALPGRLLPIKAPEEQRIPEYNYLQVLNPRFDPSVFRGGIVLVGLADTSLSNDFTVMGRHDTVRLYPVQAMAYAFTDILDRFFQ